MIKRISGLIPSLVSALLLIAILSACGEDGSKRILGHWRAERLHVQSISLPMGPEFVVTPRELMVGEGNIRIPISSIQSEDNVVTLEGPFGFGLSFYFEDTDRIYFETPLTGRVYFQRVADAVQSASTKPVPPPLAMTPAAATAPNSAQVPIAPPSVSPTPLSEPHLAHAPAAQSAVPGPIVTLPATPPMVAPSANTGDMIRQAEHKIASNALSEAESLLSEARRQYGDDPMIDYNLALLHIRQGDPDSAVRNLRDAFQNGFRDFARLDASTDFASLKSDSRYSALITRYR